MSDKVQVGLRVDKSVYEEFKQTVIERTGRWKGAGGKELEDMMRRYISEDPATAKLSETTEIDRRLQRIETAVGVQATDGGADSRELETHTHTPDRRPHPQESSEVKVKWLAKCVEEQVGADPDEVPGTVLRDMVAQEFDFRDDTVDRYVEKLVEQFGFVEHPFIDGMWVTPEKRDKEIEKRREDEHADATDDLEQL